jgi:hypothetical protein
LEENKAPDMVLETSEGDIYLVHEDVVDTIIAQEDDNGYSEVIPADIDQEPDHNDAAEDVVEEENDQEKEGQEKNVYNDSDDSTSMGDDKVTQTIGNTESETGNRFNRYEQSIGENQVTQTISNPAAETASHYSRDEQTMDDDQVAQTIGNTEEQTDSRYTRDEQSKQPMNPISEEYSEDKNSSTNCLTKLEESADPPTKWQSPTNSTNKSSQVQPNSSQGTGLYHQSYVIFKTRILCGANSSGITGENQKTFLYAMDRIGAQSFSKSFVCSGAASKSLYSTAEALLFAVALSKGQSLPRAFIVCMGPMRYRDVLEFHYQFHYLEVLLLFA